MRDDILTIPEISGLDGQGSLIRIPPDWDVPLTPRVRHIIDAPAFRRLSGISQLGLVSLVYPGAHHTRFEHSLGVYRLALLVLKRLAHESRFAAIVQPEDARLLLAAALLHDIGHYPYCHLIEDLKLPDSEPHEAAAARFILNGELHDILVKEWEIVPEDILAILNHTEARRRTDESDSDYRRRLQVYRVLMGILSGPVDIDKMDYLYRDSWAAGVPYGRHYDQRRLIGSLCLNERGDGLAITEKGKTAAELMVFARYVMFSEVYWHHAVRSATVMFQRAFDIMAHHVGTTELIANVLREPDLFWRKTLEAFPDQPNEDSPDSIEEARQLLQGIFGERRSLYKRVRQFSIMEEPELYSQLAGLPYRSLREISRKLTGHIQQEWSKNSVRSADSSASGRPLRPNDILIDAPPVDKEVEFKIDVYYAESRTYRPLSSVSPVLCALARDQFDDYVKRVRLFVHPDVAPAVRDLPDINRLLLKSL